MISKKWANTIKKQTEAAGTYRDTFKPIIQTLADILEQRDIVKQKYDEAGAEPVIEQLSDRGRPQLKQNPMLKAWMDLNAQALTYWRDLGLTPAGLKKINDSMAKIEVKESALEKALKSFGGE